MRTWQDDLFESFGPQLERNFVDGGPQAPALSEQPPIPQQQPKRAPAIVPEPQAQSVGDPMVREYLTKKYDLGNYTDENRQKIVDENSKYDLGGRVTAALAAAGAGFQGRDAGAAGSAVLNRLTGEKQAKLDNFDKMRDQKIQSNKIGRDEEKFDPNSASSMAFKKAIESNFPQIAKAYGENWANVSAADQDLIFEPLKLKENVDARKQAAWLANEARNDARDEKRQDKLDQLTVPGYERTGEVMQRPEEASKFRKATAVSDQLTRKLDRMKQLVADKGAFEWGGEAGQEMESLATEIQLLGKSPELYELGVLTGPDLSLLQKITADPSSMSSLFTRDSTRNKQIESQINSIRDKMDASSKSLGYRKQGGLPESSSGGFPRTVRKGNQTATVSSPQELEEAMSEGFQ